MSDAPRNPLDNITGVSSEEAESADFVVCVREGEEAEHFKADNVYTTCFLCGCRIIHRPNAPKAPPKLCVNCVIDKLANVQKMNTEKK